MNNIILNNELEDHGSSKKLKLAQSKSNEDLIWKGTDG